MEPIAQLSLGWRTHLIFPRFDAQVIARPDYLLVRMLDYQQNPQAACCAPRWRFNAGLEINVERAMNPATVQGLKDCGHQVDVIQDSYQDFGAGQFIWRLGDPAVEGYVAASDSRRDGLAAAF